MSLTLPDIEPFDRAAEATVLAQLALRSQPAGGLGQLTALAGRLAGMSGAPAGFFARKGLLLFAADHGIAPAADTAAQAAAILAGRAVVNALGRQAGVTLKLVDMGLRAPLPQAPNGVAVRIAAGSRDMGEAAALTPAEVTAAIEAGMTAAVTEIAAGVDVLALGIVGPGAVWPALAVTSVLADEPVAALVAAGQAQNEGVLEAVRLALGRHRPVADDPIGVLAQVGGLDLAGAVGALLAAAAARVPVLLGDQLVGAAALAAVALEPIVRDYIVAAHDDGTPALAVCLRQLRLQPLLALGLGHGDGVGALLGFHLVEAAVRALNEVP